jgi:uncharacterized protein YkwD
MRRNPLFSIALVVSGLFFAHQNVAAQQANQSVNGGEDRIFSLINRERSRFGLGSLSWDGRLADLARRYSQRMARERFFEHVDSNGNDVVARARQSRIGGWTKIGENLFMCSETPDFTGLSVRGWMRSATHRENILDPEWRTTGIGIAYSRNGDIYITEVFADG